MLSELIDDEPHAGHPTKVHADENRLRVEKLILSNHATVTELEAATGLERCPIHQFIHKLVFWKICARRVPKLLMEDHLTKKKKRPLCFSSSCFITVIHQLFGEL